MVGFERGVQYIQQEVLNAFPYPWLTSTLSLACGSLIMLVSWATRIAEAPKTDFEFWKTLLPVAVAHTIGHVAATVSMSKVAVSFTHIIKSGEPAFSVLVSRLLLGETFPAGVYMSLIPIIGGCALAAVTELNFNMIGFMGAMISNLAFVFRNIFSKRGMKGKSVSGMNYYACLSIFSVDSYTLCYCCGGTADVGSRMANSRLSDWTAFCLVGGSPKCVLSSVQPGFIHVVG
ncbi:hypothetical protein GH714_008170 [Hevea brasiliensis]|uniref:Sugar phosphate transporter domain-containing protein n=1 Tax=Hevea brasiliensis TaxID=3981 RepID=A0A6A6KAI6_HEVBR|nr:hypothetical protein GH714_008170 [Hevea brasiliensis]